MWLNAAHTDRTIMENADKDLEFYQRFSEKIHDVLKKMREGKLVDIEALKALRKIRDQVVNKEDDQLPKELKGFKEAGIFYRNLKKDF